MSFPTPIKVVCIIPARSGSKGIPGKNIYPICGKPLIAYSIEHALNASLIDRVYVSTDGDDIADVAARFGASIIRRPSTLAQDESTSESALTHALEYIRTTEHYVPELVIFLQCTSPIRKYDDINNAINHFYQSSADSLLSVVPNHRFLWQEGENGAESINYDFHYRSRRQDLKPQYCENGSIYIFKPEGLLRYQNRLHGHVALYIMSDASAYEIDEYLDLEIVENIIKKQL